MTRSSLALGLPRPRLEWNDFPRWLRGAMFVGVVVAADLVVARSVVDPRFERLVMLGLALAALAVVFLIPRLTTIGVLLIVGSVFSAGLWKLPVGPLSVRLGELVLGALLVVAVVKPKRAWIGGFAGAALIAFLAVVGLAALLAIDAGRTTVSDAYAWGRDWGMLLIFFVVVRLFPEPEDVRRLLFGACVIAALTGLVTLFVAAPGSSLEQTLNPADSSMIRSDEGLGVVNRVRLPGVMLAYGLFWYAALQAAATHGRARLVWLLLIAGMSVSLALSFNRNMWVGLALGLVLVLVIVGGGARQRLLTAMVIVAAGAIVLTLASPRVSDSSPLYPIIERGTTLFDPSQTARESSLDDRRVETRRAVTGIREHPWLGVGAGASWGSVGIARAPDNRLMRTEQLFLHNQYLYLLLVGGPLALITFVAFIGSLAAAPLRARVLSVELAGLAVGLAITMVSAVVMIAFADATGAMVIGLLGGAIAVLMRADTDGARA